MKSPACNWCSVGVFEEDIDSVDFKTRTFDVIVFHRVCLNEMLDAVAEKLEYFEKKVKSA